MPSNGFRLQLGHRLLRGDSRALHAHRASPDHAAVHASNAIVHAVFEAIKRIAAKIRRLSGLDGDGANLAQAAFGFPRQGQPVLADC